MSVLGSSCSLVLGCVVLVLVAATAVVVFADGWDFSGGFSCCETCGFPTHSFALSSATEVLSLSCSISGGFLHQRPPHSVRERNQGAKKNTAKNGGAEHGDHFLLRLVFNEKSTAHQQDDE